jgi:hypothetical protein
MMDKIKDLVFYLVIGYAVIGASSWLESSFLHDWLKRDLITLLVALLAINTTTSSVMMTKLKEIAERTGTDFGRTISQLKHSVIEQITYVIVAVIVLILVGSQKVLALHGFVEFLLTGVLAAVFVAAIHNLSDTANSIFVILHYENQKK